MGHQCFDVSLDGKVAHVVLTRPEKRNSMIPAFWDELPEIVPSADIQRFIDSWGVRPR